MGLLLMPVQKQLLIQTRGTTSSCPSTNPLGRMRRTLNRCSGQPSPTRMLNPNAWMDAALLGSRLDMHWDGIQEDTGGLTMDAGGPTMDAGGHTGGIEKVIYEIEL